MAKIAFEKYLYDFETKWHRCRDGFRVVCARPSASQPAPGPWWFFSRHRHSLAVIRSSSGKLQTACHTAMPATAVGLPLSGINRTLGSPFLFLNYLGGQEIQQAVVSNTIL